MAVQPIQITLRPPGTASLAPDLLAEANHRIANSLTLVASMVRLQASDLEHSARMMDGRELRRILEAFGGRISTVARLHHLLAAAGDADQIDLADYLRGIA